MLYTFFWSGPFSQWAKSPFVIDNMKFNTAEQYMMYKKAIRYGDNETAEKIMKTSNPRVQKALGRQVKNFDAQDWSSCCRTYVYEANYAKFKQNPKLLKLLLMTEGTILCEASPYDAIWGCGLSEALARGTPPEKWPGTNWLGLVLTQVRDDIIKQQPQKSILYIFCCF